MVETRWPELGGKHVRYHDRTWELTGMVDVRGTGDLLDVEATRVDDVRHGNAVLRFGLENPPASLNPGNLGDHFDELEREDDRYHLVVKKEARTYRYALHGIEYR
ncbi:MAG: hypothetical protein R3324_22180 [Halobacteriales archaeon]|nr:hypothetical protein [Halobacteriales archaeon]